MVYPPLYGVFLTLLISKFTPRKKYEVSLNEGANSTLQILLTLLLFRL